LVLNVAQHAPIRFQSYEKWLSRLTSERNRSRPGVAGA
jgi:hypothetical protein